MREIILGKSSGRDAIKVIFKIAPIFASLTKQEKGKDVDISGLLEGLANLDGKTFDDIILTVFKTAEMRLDCGTVFKVVEGETFIQEPTFEEIISTFKKYYELNLQGFMKGTGLPSQSKAKKSTAT